VTDENDRSKFGPAILSADYNKVGKLLRETIFPHLAKVGLAAPAPMAGFCYGSWIVIQACGDAALADKIKCGIHFHPSVGVDSMVYGRNPILLAYGVKQPTLLLPAGNDPSYLHNDGEFARALRSHGAHCEVELFANMQHGWVVRGDVKDLNVSAAVQKALERAIAFAAADHKNGQ
jgi:dienelactone hydrolase